MRPDAKARFVTALVLFVVAFLVGLFGIFLRLLPVLQGQAVLTENFNPGTIFFIGSWAVLAGLALWQLLTPSQV